MKMKRFFAFLVIVCLMAATTPAKAQGDGEWTLSGGVGWYSLPDLIGVLTTIGVAFSNPDEATTHNTSLLLNPSVELRYGLNDWLSLGGSLTVGYAGAMSVLDDTGKVHKSLHSIYPTFCVSALTRYFSSGRFTMYGSWGVGAMVLLSKQNYDGEESFNSGVAIMGNAYPLGFSYGGKTKGFVELGWGARGFVSAGVHYNF